MKGRITERVFGGFGAAIVEVQIVFPGEAHAAVNLDAAIADSARSVNGIKNSFSSPLTLGAVCPGRANIFSEYLF
jgi:hypothetical protein